MNRMDDRTTNRVFTSHKFQTYVRQKKRVLFILTVLFLSYFLMLPILASFWPNLMTIPVLPYLSFGWIFALSQFIMTAIICLVYLGLAKRFDQRAKELSKEFLDK